MFRFNQYEQSAINSCAGSCLPYFLVALLVVCGLAFANAQDPQPPGLPAMPPYEERDTLVKYEDGLYLEKIFINRTRIDEGYVEQERNERKRREADEEKRAARLEEVERKLREKDGGKSNPKKEKKPPDATAPKKG
jgi:hypothetical protein